MNLSILFAPLVPIQFHGFSCLAKLESVRHNGSLDLEFGRKLVAAGMGGGAKDEDEKALLTENDILKQLITGYDVASLPNGQIKPLVLSAMVFVAPAQRPGGKLRVDEKQLLVLF